MQNQEQEAFIEINQGDANAINHLCATIFDWAKKKGWYQDGDRNKGELIALMHSELSECLEAIRQRGTEFCPHCPSKITEYLGIEIDDGPIWKCHMCGKQHIGPRPEEIPYMDDKTPELTGEAAELADCVIRIFDYCGAHNIDLGNAIRVKHAFNITRPHRHGAKRF